MKKYFKSPDEAKKVDAKAVMKILKKVFGKGIEGSKFFYKAEFDYANGELAPFMYIGAMASPWKMYVKQSKKDKDFVAGLCKLEMQDGVQKLLLKAEMGKGSKALFLKAVNKELLKRIGVKAEFVEELVISAMDAEEDDAEDAGEDDAPEAAPDTAENTAALSPQEMSDNLKSIAGTFKIIRTEHSAEQIDDLLDQIADWEDNYESLSAQHKQVLAASLAKAQEVGAYLQKINQVDSKIDALLDKIYPLIDSYIEMEDHDAAEALALKEKVEKSIGKVEQLAQKINDNDFVLAAQKFRALLSN